MTKNILVLHKGPDWWVKISDFGISKRIGSTFPRTQVSTEPYMAPEVKGLFPMDDQPDGSTNESISSLAVDVWSVGAITFQVVCGRLAFPDGRQLFEYVVQGFSFPTVGPGNLDCADFIQNAMAASADQRPTCHQALAHPWLRIQLPESASSPVAPMR